jgi:RyR domain
MNYDQIARVAHEVNRAYCQALGDTSQPPWEIAPEWQRVSAISGVVFHSANPDASPVDSHNAWLKEKAADGWNYGPVKDDVKKEHPCFVPYANLPTEQKAKDYLFRAVVQELLLLP